MPLQMILKSINMGEGVKPFVRRKHPCTLKGCKLRAQRKWRAI